MYRERIKPPIPAPRERTDVLRSIRVVAQRLAQFIDGHPEAVIEILDGIVGPDPLTEFVPRNHLAGLIQEGM